MAGQGRPPTFEVRRRPGDRTAVELQRFDAHHPRAILGAHDHEDLEVLFFERGGGRHRVGDRSWVPREGDVVLVAPRLQHDLGSLDGAWGWALQFSPEDLAAEGGRSGPLLLWRANPLLNPFLAAEADPQDGLFHLAPAEREEWSTRMGRLEREVHDRPEGSGQAISALLTLTLVDLARLAHDVTGVLHERQDPVLTAVFDLIEQRFDTELTLSDVADTLGYSATYLTTIVRSRTGRTVLDWITHRRMAHARKLLLETDLSHQAIAGRCGFRDPAYFSRRFRQMHSESPSAWRAAAAGELAR